MTLISTDADDYVRPQRQLEQLLSGAGAAYPLHGAEAGWAESMLPSNVWAAVSGPTSPKPGDQVKKKQCKQIAVTLYSFAHDTVQDVLSKIKQILAC